MEKRDVFNREPRYFKAAGREYKIEFIPAEHFNAVLVHALSLVVKFNATGSIVVSEDKKTVKINEALFQTVENTLNTVLQNQVYELIADVVQYQNEGAETSGVTASYLRKRLSLTEMLNFIGLVLADDEILDALEVFVKRAGELFLKAKEKKETLLQKIEEPSLTPKSTPSSPENSDTASTTHATV